MPSQAHRPRIAGAYPRHQVSTVRPAPWSPLAETAGVLICPDGYVAWGRMPHRVAMMKVWRWP